MKKLRLGALALVLFQVMPAYGGYQGEIAGGYGERDYDADNAESSGTRLSLRYFLSPVQAEKIPIRLAPFMERQSFVSAGWEEARIEQGPMKLDQQAATLQGDFQLGASDFRLGGGVAHWEIDGEAVREYAANLDWYYHSVGAVSLMGSQRSDNDDLNQIDVSETGVGIAQVLTFGGSHFLVQGQYFRETSTIQAAGSSNDVPAVTYSRQFQVSWFPGRKLGLGLAWHEQSTRYYELRSSDYEAESSGYLLVMQYDVSERFGSSISIGPGNEKERIEWYAGGGGSTYRDMDIDYNAIEGSLTWRF